MLHELHSLQRLVTSTCHLYSQCQMKFNNCNYWAFFVTGTTLVYMWTPWKDSLSLSGWLTRSRFRWQPSGQTLLSLKVAVGPILLVTSGQGARYNNKIWVRYIIQSNHLLRSNNFSLWLFLIFFDIQLQIMNWMRKSDRERTSSALSSV